MRKTSQSIALTIVVAICLAMCWFVEKNIELKAGDNADHIAVVVVTIAAITLAFVVYRISDAKKLASEQRTILVNQQSILEQQNTMLSAQNALLITQNETLINQVDLMQSQANKLDARNVKIDEQTGTWMSKIRVCIKSSPPSERLDNVRTSADLVAMTS